MSCNCKTNINEYQKPPQTVVNTVGRFLMLLAIGLIAFPILYIYVNYLILKSIITGKENKISEIAKSLAEAINKFKNYNGDEDDDEDEYDPEYDINKVSYDDLELLDVEDEELQNKN